MLVPGLTSCLETLVTCHLAVVGQLTVLVFARKVLLSAVINMPPGQFEVNLLVYHITN